MLNEGCLFKYEGWIIGQLEWGLNNGKWGLNICLTGQMRNRQTKFPLWSISINLQKHAHTTSSLCCQFSFDA